MCGSAERFYHPGVGGPSQFFPDDITDGLFSLGTTGIGFSEFPVFGHVDTLTYLSRILA